MANFAVWRSEVFPEGLDDDINGLKEFLKELGAEVMQEYQKMHLAEYIHAWADGVEVEYFEGNFTSAGERWKRVEFSHNWTMPSACKYRLKPKTIKIGNIEVPEPMRVAPPLNAAFWVPGLCEGVPKALVSRWTECSDYLLLLESGFCQTSRAAAIAHAKALFDLTKQAMG